MSVTKQETDTAFNLGKKGEDKRFMGLVLTKSYHDYQKLLNEFLRGEREAEREKKR